jgi:diguanylate cyclase (GGDEF)-like protein
LSLSRQLVLLICLLVAVLLAGSLLLSLGNARSYLEAQLASHAQDAATSLGLSASAHVQAEDRAMVTAMVNAMFHRGDYLSIRFEDLDGQPWVERTTPLLVEGVPGWFVRLMPLEPPEGVAAVMAGWRQAGRVRVHSHPGLAQAQLWETARETAMLFLAGGALVLLAGLLGLRVLLRPLGQIRRQAEAVCRRDFRPSGAVPLAREFRPVVRAMDELAERVSHMLDEAEESATRLRAQALQDTVTGLANRRHLEAVLAQHLDDRERCTGGGLVLIELVGLRALNRARGYAAGDRLLRAAGEALAQCTERHPNTTAARTSGAGFAVLVGQGDAHDLAALAAALSGALAALHRPCGLASPDVAHVGAAACHGQGTGGLLAAADLALRQAQRDGPNAWRIAASAESQAEARPASDWRSLIGEALDAGRITLLRQPVLAADGSGVIHQELSARLQDPARPGVAIPAATFVPMAEQGGLATALDRRVLGAALDAIEDGEAAQRLAVNLNPGSLADAALLDWLTGRLAETPLAQGRLALELPEYGVASDPAPLGRWIERLAPFGVRFGLDQFGRGFGAFAYLRGLPLDYLKLDGSLVRDLAEREDSRLLLRALIDIGHGLGMQVLGESVESEQAWVGLKQLGADGGRGFWLGMPEPAWTAN